MKKMITGILIGLCCITESFGQSYQLNVTTGIYSDLSSPTSLNQGQTWIDPEYHVGIGFNFPFYGGSFDSLCVHDGNISLFHPSDTFLWPYNADLMDRRIFNDTLEESSINYNLEGITPNRVFKIEWKDHGFYHEWDSLTTCNSFGNVQLWLYESGIWEIRIGPNYITDTSIVFNGNLGPFIGFGKVSTPFCLSGNPATPFLPQSSSGYCNALSGVPVNGTIYQFSPITSISEMNTIPDFNIYPNPSSNEIRIKSLEAGTIKIYSVDGRIIYTEDIESTENYHLNISTIKAGAYLFEYISESDFRVVKKIIINE